LGKPTQDDHIELVDAVQDRDVERAVTVLQRHLNNASATIRHYLDTRQPD